MSVDSFCRVESLPVDVRWFSQFCEDIRHKNAQRESDEDNVIITLSNTSSTRLHALAQRVLEDLPEFSGVTLSVADREWTLNGGEWQICGHKKYAILRQDRVGIMLHMQSDLRSMTAEKSSVMKQFHLGIIPFVKKLSKSRPAVGRGCIDVIEFKDEDLKAVVNGLRGKGVKLELLPTVSFVAETKEGLELVAKRELRIDLASIDVSRFEVPRRKSHFTMPKPLMGFMKAEELYIFIRDELQLVAQSSPLSRISQHDISVLQQGEEEELITMLEARGYKAEIAGPYVQADIFGRCNLIRSLFVVLPDA